MALPAAVVGSEQMPMRHSHFFALLSRLRWIKRWGLMRNAYEENVMEHSWEVAVIAHALALIKNRLFDGRLDANAVAAAALFHDVSEVMTGDLPTPIKYHSDGIKSAYKSIESQAEGELLALLPEFLRPDYQRLLQDSPAGLSDTVKAADKIAAYLKCRAELKAGNEEFAEAAEELKTALQQMRLPEVDYFIDVFVAGYGMSLDKLMKNAEVQAD